MEALQKSFTIEVMRMHGPLCTIVIQIAHQVGASAGGVQDMGLYQNPLSVVIGSLLVLHLSLNYTT